MTKAARVIVKWECGRIGRMPGEHLRPCPKCGCPDVAFVSWPKRGSIVSTIEDNVGSSLTFADGSTAFLSLFPIDVQ